MRKTLWNLILVSFASGIFVVGGFWGFTILDGDIKFLTLIPIIFGIFGIFYARYG